MIVDDCIVIPYDTLESKVFKPAAEAIIRNIYAQLIKLPKGERQLDSMLLVGNCGFEWYLLRQMKNHFEGRTIGATYVGLPPDFQLAISRGAVSFGLEPMLSSESFSRYSYYLQVRDIYRYQLDDPEQKVVGYDGQEYCPNIFSEVIAKGTKITKGSVCIQRVFVTYPNNFILGKTCKI